MLTENAIMNEKLTISMVNSNRSSRHMSPMDFLESFCHLIGDPNSILRGDLMDPVFRTFGENDETFSNDEAAAIIERLTGPENLSYDVDNNGASIAFKRSYSALVVACILWRHQEKPFLSETQLSRVHERLRPVYMTMVIA